LGKGQSSSSLKMLFLILTGYTGSAQFWFKHQKKTENFTGQHNIKFLDKSRTMIIGSNFLLVMSFYFSGCLQK